jgi:hypothetical protein
MIRVGLINAVKLVSWWKYGRRWMKEVLSQQQSSNGIGLVDGDNQEQV